MSEIVDTTPSVLIIARKITEVAYCILIRDATYGLSYVNPQIDIRQETTELALYLKERKPRSIWNLWGITRTWYYRYLGKLDLRPGNGLRLEFKGECYDGLVKDIVARVNEVCRSPISIEMTDGAPTEPLSFSYGPPM